MVGFRVGVAVLVWAAQGLCSNAFAADEETWALLKKPGHVVLLRHSNAPGQVQESNDMDFKNCAIQRNLDADGRAHMYGDRLNEKLDGDHHHDPNLQNPVVLRDAPGIAVSTTPTYIEDMRREGLDVPDTATKGGK